MAITELTEFQFNTLNNGANGATRVVIVVGASPSDSFEKASLYNQQQREMGELVHLGLVEDVSKHYAESINTSKINNNREFEVFAITELAMRMFEGFQERLVN